MIKILVIWASFHGQPMMSLEAMSEGQCAEMAAAAQAQRPDAFVTCLPAEQALVLKNEGVCRHVEWSGSSEINECVLLSGRVAK